MERFGHQPKKYAFQYRPAKSIPQQLDSIPQTIKGQSAAGKILKSLCYSRRLRWLRSAQICLCWLLGADFPKNRHC
jgi:hypothetical protein